MSSTGNKAHQAVAGSSSPLQPGPEYRKCVVSLPNGRANMAKKSPASESWPDNQLKGMTSK